MPRGEPRAGAGAARLDRLAPLINDRWPLYLVLWLVLVAAALFPGRRRPPSLHRMHPRSPACRASPVKAGAIRLAWSYDLASSPLATNRARPCLNIPRSCIPGGGCCRRSGVVSNARRRTSAGPPLPS